VEARIHAWLDERCVEPRVQQIVLPGLWPRKKNTRGGDDEDINEEAIEDEEDSDGDAEREPRRTPSARVMQDITNDGGLESRMAAEGQKLLASEGRLPRESRREPADDGVRRRNPNLKKNVSTENMRIPGQFD
jgi:maintenance of mitochondrial morphology protein 1